MCPWQLHRRPGPYVTSGQTEWSWWLMSCRKETGDISNDHISDQLVLEPEELVLTDVTARTGLAFFLRPSSNILQKKSCKNPLKVLVCIRKHFDLGLFFLFITFSPWTARNGCATKSLTENYYFWSWSIEQTNQPVPWSNLTHPAHNPSKPAWFPCKFVKSSCNLWNLLKVHARRLRCQCLDISNKVALMSTNQGKCGQELALL